MVKGFTIIECLISILLLTIIMVGGMALFFYPQGYYTASAHRKVATDIASAQLEGLKKQLITNWDSAFPASLPITIGGLSGTVRIPQPFSSCGTDCKAVQVKISWNEPEKAALQEVILDTCIAK
jgi:prepilin-type N-terminal cleavage/methylation domain-containing protein